MVYPGHRSTGCLRCVARKVKCDENRPECLRCRKRGEECQFRREKYKFVGEDDRLTATDNSSLLEPARSSTTSRSNSSASDSAFAETIAPPTIEPSHHVTDAEVVAWYFHNYNVSQPNDSMTGWFSFLPTMYNEVEPEGSLRMAILATALAAYANFHKIDHILRRARRKYGLALLRLKERLDDSVLAVEDETVVTILLLTIFGCLTGKGSPLRPHMNGLTAIMQLRGKEQLSTARGRILLRMVIYHFLTRGIVFKIDQHTALTTEAIRWLSSRSEGRVHVERLTLLSDVARFCIHASEKLKSEQFLQSSFELTTMMRDASNLDIRLSAAMLELPTSVQPRDMVVNNEWVEVYMTQAGPTVFNNVRFARIVLHETLLRCGNMLQIENWSDESLIQPGYVSDSSNSKATIQSMAYQICSSFSFSIGDIDNEGASTGKRPTSLPGRAGMCYLMQIPLATVRWATHTTEEQKMFADQALSRINDDWGIHQSGLLRQRDGKDAWEL